MKKKNSSNALQAELETLSTRKYKSISKVRGADAVVYTRVSSQEQAENNGSLEVQLKYCNNYAKNNSIKIKEYFGGSYESAKSDGRKEFLRMIEYVKKHKNISYIIVFNYDRFSRTGAAASQLSEELSLTPFSLIFHEGASTNFSEVDIPKDISSIYLVIGPEGGITEDELKMFTGSTSNIIKLGEPVLRSAHAGFAALAAVQTKLGRW